MGSNDVGVNMVNTKKPVAFISHNKNDKDIAREIGIFLVSDDVNMWFDEWEISAGDSIVEQINKGLKDCTHFLILWSKNSAKSNWVRRELNSTLSRAIDSRSIKVIPIVLDDTPLPELLADIRYIKYKGGIEQDRSEIISAIVGRQPTTNYIRAVVKKFNEVIFDNNSDEVLPFTACPNCGSDRLKRECYTDYQKDENYYIIRCLECDWGDWTQ